MIEARWDYYLRKARQQIEDGTLDEDEGYKAELGRTVTKARDALLANDENWSNLVKDAITHKKNNLINPRSYGKDQDSNQTKVIRWIDDSLDQARDALLELWAEDEREPVDRVRAFNAKLPEDAFSKGSTSPRLDVASYLMMGRDPDRFPQCRLSSFHSTYKRLGYPRSDAGDVAGEYKHALEFLDHLQTEAEKRGMKRPSTRLDAQSVVWSLKDLSLDESTGRGSADDNRAHSEVNAAFVSPHALNTILYGPPGTGKTYATVRRCVEICDGKPPPNVDALRARYGELMDEGRIEFVTFHQSYGYEEFVEGLRPIADEAGGGSLRLAVKEGILKRIAERARKIPEIGGRRILKMSLGDPKSRGGTPHGDAIFADCIDSGCVLLEYGGDIDWSDSRYEAWGEIWERWLLERNPDATVYDTDIQAMWRFRIDMRPGDIVVVSDGYRHFRAVGEITGDYEFERREDGFHHRRAVEWLWHVRERAGEPVSVFKSGIFQWRPVNILKPENPAGLNPYLRGIGEISRIRPHVLVIDEINRANISKVMGELITLLEEDKREGAENEVTVTLPYSDKQFTLPANLHIVGTMNTADRSIALLDTALRRRFRFEEMSPEPDLLKEASERTGVDLPRVLRAMNERLEYLVDRDHLLGHAWFMNSETREDVDDAMRHKIIPLIAEYFYDDWSKVQAVLGGKDHFVDRRRLNAPPGLEANMGEDRYRWTVREAFAEDAYERLVGSGTQGESSE
ncbi:AAA family ATPase [Candidatus Rariloculus sp.]|uniref:AAA family ATPase n=1 Tax=Candidatus Rariloculus sp. TaxID=3101265 RepID=UPI003D103FF5